MSNHDHISPELLEQYNKPHKDEINELELSWLLMEMDKLGLLNLEDR